jgi:hypothetical protein
MEVKTTVIAAAALATFLAGTALLTSPLLTARAICRSTGPLISGAWSIRWETRAGDLSGTVAVYETIVFDGAGHYSIPAGAYIRDVAGGSADSLCFMYSSGVLTGSTTENGYNDLMVAVEAASPVASNQTPEGTWSIAGFIAGLGARTAGDTSFQLTADGSGSVSAVTAAGYFGKSGATRRTQSIGATTYAFSNGLASINFPSISSPAFITGPENPMFSPDGDFVFGGAPGGYDMTVAGGATAGRRVPRFSSQAATMYR